MEFNYKEYFDKIKPKGKMAIYNRFLFAFLSVHTTWESNIRAYQLLKGNYWTSDRHSELHNRLIVSRIGLYNNRAIFITKFTDNFIKDYKFFLKGKKEKWKQYRDRLMDSILGLGHAKTSFAIEMIYPNAAWVTCVDTHVAQLFNTRQEKLSRKGYDDIEQKLINAAKKDKILPTQWRWSWWDVKQGYTNPRYWSYVLEAE